MHSCMGKTVPKFLFASMFFSQTVFPRMVNNLFFSAGLFFSHFTTNVAVKKKLQTMVFMVKSWTSSELQSKYFQLIIVNPLSVKKTFILYNRIVLWLVLFDPLLFS